MIAHLLAESQRYKVILVDSSSAALTRISSHDKIKTYTLNATDKKEFDAFVGQHPVDAVIVSLPYFCNYPLAEFAHEHGLHYFNLTEDVDVFNAIKSLSDGAKKTFVPACGLAPGLVNIVAASLMHEFDEIDTVKLRVGCLPKVADNALKYALTWSVDGLINEYANTCYGVINGKKMPLQPLTDLEHIVIEGVQYESFNTSGGIGSLVESFGDKVKNLNYKSLRYPGHRDKIQFLMRSLKLSRDRDLLKQILTRALPETNDDKVLLYVSVTGQVNGKHTQKTCVKSYYAKKIFKEKWSAIQITTAASACAVLDIVLQNEEKYQGLVLQERFSLADILMNPFGKFLHGDDDE